MALAPIKIEKLHDYEYAMLISDQDQKDKIISKASWFKLVQASLDKNNQTLVGLSEVENWLKRHGFAVDATGQLIIRD